MNEYKKEDIRNIHYNNKNEIQFEYGGQVHHYRMENLKEVFINCWNLQQENKQLKDNWNKLKEWINKHYDYYMNNEDYIGGRLCFTDMKDKMQEIEQGSDSNVKNKR